MIEIIQGEESQLKAYFAGLRPETPALWLTEQTEGIYGFDALRQLISQLESRSSQEDLREKFHRDRAAASFVDQRLIDQLTPAELQRRQYYSARIASNLSHNWYLQRPLLRSLAKTVSNLLPEEEITLLIPVLNHLDFPSVAVIKALYRLFPDQAPRLLLGYESKAEQPELDTNGIDWSTSQLYLQNFVQSLVSASSSPIVDLDRNEIGPKSDRRLDRANTTSPHSRFPCLEARAMKMLERSAESADLNLGDGGLRDGDRATRDLIEAIVGAIRLTFECYEFHTAMRLGLKLLEQERHVVPYMEPRELADVHSLVALSAHNLDLGRSSAGPEIKQYLAHHYETALANETRPAVRCALCYRLAVTYGRRMKDLQRGMHWADMAITEAQALDLPSAQKLYYECWGRNIKSYILMLQGEIKNGFEEGQLIFGKLTQALETLSGGTSVDEEHEQDLWRRELFMTQVVVCENMSTLGYRTKSAAQYLDWLKTQEELVAKDMINFDELNAYNWVHFYSEQLQPSLALPWVQKGIESMRKSFLAELEQELVLIASSIHDRLGNAAEASEYVDQFLTGFSHLRTELSKLAQELDYVKIFMRSGHLDRAEQVLQRALQGTEGQTPEGKGELFANLGLLAATRGDAETAEQLVNQAIGFAVESGARNTLMRVAIITADACFLLDRMEDARDAYQKALELAEADPASPPPPEELFEIYLGLCECHPRREEWGLRALGLLPGVLSSDDAWWSLGRLLSAVRRVARNEPELLHSESLQEALDALLRAAAQRTDCHAPYTELIQLPVIRPHLARLGEPVGA